jgi:hypothetical protein
MRFTCAAPSLLAVSMASGVACSQVFPAHDDTPAIDGGPGICEAGDFVLDGTLDGATAAGSYAGPFGFSFTNFVNDQPGVLDIGFGSGGTLHLTWTMLVEDDATVAATGTLLMPSQGPSAGKSFCVTRGTVTSYSEGEGGGVSFVLSELASGACPGAALEGSSLAGCATPAEP